MALNFAGNQGKGKQSDIIDPWSTLWTSVPTMSAASSSSSSSSASASASSSSTAVGRWLPDELWLAIFSALTSSKDLSNLSLTNRHFNQIATPLLVHSLNWRKALPTLRNLTWWNEHPEGRQYVRQVVLSIGGFGAREDEMKGALGIIKNAITVGTSGNARRWGAILAHSDNIYPYLLSQVSRFSNLSKLTLTDAELPSSVYSILHSLGKLTAVTIVRCMLPGIPRSHRILQTPTVSQISKIGLEDISILDARGLLGLPAGAALPQPPLNNPGVFGVAGFNPPLPPNNPNNIATNTNAARDQAFHPLTLLPSIHLTSLRIHWRGELALSLINFAFPLPHLTSLTIHIKNLTQFVLNPVMSFIRGFQGSLEELNVMVESLAKSLEMQAVMAAMAVAGPAGAANVGNVAVPNVGPANGNVNVNPNGPNPVVMVGPGGGNVPINPNVNVNVINALVNVVAPGAGGAAVAVGGAGAGGTGTLVMRRLKKFRGPVLIANAISAGQQQVFLDRARNQAQSPAPSSNYTTGPTASGTDAAVHKRLRHVGVEEWELHGPITLGSFLDFLEHCTAKEEVRKLTALLQHWNTEALMAVSQLMTGLRELCLVWASGAGPNDDFLVSVGPEILPRLPFLEVLTLVPEAPYLKVPPSATRPDKNQSPPRGRYQSHPRGGSGGAGGGGGGTGPNPGSRGRNDPFLSSSAMLEGMDIDDDEEDIDIDIDDLHGHGDSSAVGSSSHRMYPVPRRPRASRRRESVTAGVEDDEEADSVRRGRGNNDEMPRLSSRSYRSMSPAWGMDMDHTSMVAGGSQDPIHEEDPELLDIVIREARDAGQPLPPRLGGTGPAGSMGVSEGDRRRMRDNDPMEIDYEGDRTKKAASSSNGGASNAQESSMENENANANASANPNQHQPVSLAGNVAMTPEYVGDLLAGWRRFSGELREVCLVRRNVWRRIELEDRSQSQTREWRSSASSMSSMTSASVSTSLDMDMDMESMLPPGSSASGSFSLSPPPSSSSSTGFATSLSPGLSIPSGSSTPLSNLSYRGFDFDSTAQGPLSSLPPVSPPPLLSNSGWLAMDSLLVGPRNGSSNSNGKGKGKGKGRGDGGGGGRKPKNRWEHFYCDEDCIPTLRVHPLSQDGWMD